MGDIGIGNPVSYQFFNVIFVWISVWTRHRYHTDISVPGIGSVWGILGISVSVWVLSLPIPIYWYRYRYIGIGRTLSITIIGHTIKNFYITHTQCHKKAEIKNGRILQEPLKLPFLVPLDKNFVCFMVDMQHANHSL